MGCITIYLSCINRHTLSHARTHNRKRKYTHGHTHAYTHTHVYVFLFVLDDNNKLFLNEVTEEKENNSKPVN